MNSITTEPSSNPNESRLSPEANLLLEKVCQVHDQARQRLREVAGEDAWNLFVGCGSEFDVLSPQRKLMQETIEMINSDQKRWFPKGQSMNALVQPWDVLQESGPKFQEMVRGAQEILEANTQRFANFEALATGNSSLIDGDMKATVNRMKEFVEEFRTNTHEHHFETMEGIKGLQEEFQSKYAGELSKLMAPASALDEKIRLEWRSGLFGKLEGMKEFETDGRLVFGDGLPKPLEGWRELEDLVRKEFRGELFEQMQEMNSRLGELWSKPRLSNPMELVRSGPLGFARAWVRYQPICADCGRVQTCSCRSNSNTSCGHETCGKAKAQTVAAERRAPSHKTKPAVKLIAAPIEEKNTPFWEQKKNCRILRGWKEILTAIGISANSAAIQRLRRAMKSGPLPIYKVGSTVMADEGALLAWHHGLAQRAEMSVKARNGHGNLEGYWDQVDQGLHLSRNKP